MSDIPTKRKGELVRAALGLLSKEPEGLHVQEVLERLRKVIPPTEFELGSYDTHPGTNKYDVNLRFATIGAVKGGWLQKTTKGHWTITDQGKQALKQFSDPEALMRESHRLYLDWKNKNKGNKTKNPDETPLSSNEADVDLDFAQEAEQKSWAQITSFISRMSWIDFQNCVVPGLLTAMGYHVAWSSPPGPDGGMDIIAFPDELGIKEPRIKVSVKKRDTNKAGITEVKELIASLHGSDVGIFISIAGFTKDAMTFVRAERRNIRLLDQEQFFDLWVKHYDKIPEPNRTAFPLVPVHFLKVSNL